VIKLVINRDSFILKLIVHSHIDRCTYRHIIVFFFFFVARKITKCYHFHTISDR